VAVSIALMGPVLEVALNHIYSQAIKIPIRGLERDAPDLQARILITMFGRVMGVRNRCD
jgi:hypothetical protein